MQQVEYYLEAKRPRALEEPSPEGGDLYFCLAVGPALAATGPEALGERLEAAHRELLSVQLHRREVQDLQQQLHHQDLQHEGGCSVREVLKERT